MTDKTIDDLKTRLRAISDEFVESWMTLHAEFPDELWHYTNAKGLLGIFQSNELWFSDASFLNDASEMSYAVDLTKKIVDEKLMDEGISPVIKEYFEGLVKTLVSQRENSKDYGIVNPAFVCCFCEEADSLHLWRAYSDQGRGYSIGFFPDFIVSKLVPIRLADRATINGKLYEKWRCFQPFLCKVVYQEATQREILNGLLDSLATAIGTAPLEFPSGNENNTHKIVVIWEFFRLFYLCLLCFKDPSFYDEREWRLIYCPYFGTVNDMDSVAIAELHYRPSGNYFVPYLKIDVGKEEVVDHGGTKVNIKTLVFEDIFAGPGLDVRLARASFNAYVLRNGYLGSNVGVHQSKVPLRALDR